MEQSHLYVYVLRKRVRREDERETKGRKKDGERREYSERMRFVFLYV